MQIRFEINHITIEERISSRVQIKDESQLKDSGAISVRKPTCRKNNSGNFRASCERVPSAFFVCQQEGVSTVHCRPVGIMVVNPYRSWKRWGKDKSNNHDPRSQSTIHNRNQDKYQVREMGNVLAAALRQPPSPVGSKDDASTTSKPVNPEPCQQFARNPGTVEDLHKKCKGTWCQRLVSTLITTQTSCFDTINRPVPDAVRRSTIKTRGDVVGTFQISPNLKFVIWDTIRVPDRSYCGLCWNKADESIGSGHWQRHFAHSSCLQWACSG